MKKILIIFIEILILIGNLSSETYKNKIIRFKFSYNDDYIKLYLFDDPQSFVEDVNSQKFKNKKLHLIIAYQTITDLSEDTPARLRIKKMILEDKKMLNNNYYEINNADQEISSRISIVPKIINRKNINIVYYTSFLFTYSIKNEKIINKLEGNILFFKEDYLITIALLCIKDDIPNLIKQKSNLLFKKYFNNNNEFINEKSQLLLYNDIINININLSDEIKFWYKSFNKIINTFEFY